MDFHQFYLVDFGIFDSRIKFPNITVTTDRTVDFYELEIASGGVMRSFMMVPCNETFTIQRKVRRFLETTFKIYNVPEEKIEEAAAFVSQFDYPALAQNTINQLLTHLDETWIG